jgi:gentisate 1,2-dioxygenase
VAGDQEYAVATGDLVVVPSWVPWSVHADDELDLFRFNDGPIIERLGFARTYVDQDGR